MRDEWRKAIIEGEVNTIEVLLAEERDIDCRDKYGQTGVMLAATHGQIEILRILLDEGAGMDATAKHGLSALMLAVVNHHVECAMLLIDAGASIYLQGSGAPGFAGKTAHDLAVQNGQGDLAAYIARAGEKDSS